MGDLLLVSKGGKLTGIYFAGQRHIPSHVMTWPEAPRTPIFQATIRQLKEYFAGSRSVFDLDLEPEGTEFQKKVWRALQKIPRGKLTSYGFVARRVGRPAGARAVGGAIGRNPIAIVIPCHRVIGTNQTLTGYAAGLSSKKALLQIEGMLVKDGRVSSGLPQPIQ